MANTTRTMMNQNNHYDNYRALQHDNFNIYTILASFVESTNQLTIAICPVERSLMSSSFFAIACAYSKYGWNTSQVFSH